MAGKELIVSLSKILTLPEDKGVNKTYVDIILQEEIPILCINKALRKKRLMPFKVLNDNMENFWQKSGNWRYYITRENIDLIRKKAVAKTGSWEFDIPKTEDKSVLMNIDDEIAELLEEPNSYGKDYQYFLDMSNAEKVEYINKDKKRLDEFIGKKFKDEAAVTEALVDTTKDAALINHAIIEEALFLADDEAKKLTQDLVDSTNEMIKSSALLMTEDVFSNELMNLLVERSNGTIIQHMTRVYLNGIGFLSYYNKLVSTSSAIQKLRISFPGKFRKMYHTLLPHVDIDDINLERVFYGGMRAITPEAYFKWAVGFLVHDIGKASAVEYHEGEGSYDRQKVIEHVKQGYKSIMTKTNYPMEAGLITGYHHEYYGDSAGYGFFRAYLQQYKKQKPEAKQDYCITYELEPILDYQALAYFPAKVLEIIDVYDSLTDPHRIYRKPMTPMEALEMMHEEFIAKRLKIDPILFSFFVNFTKKRENIV